MFQAVKIYFTNLIKPKFIYRVKINHLPTHEVGSIKRFLQTLDLHTFKKAPKWDYAYMNFEVLPTRYLFLMRALLTVFPDRGRCS